MIQVYWYFAVPETLLDWSTRVFLRVSERAYNVFGSGWWALRGVVSNDGIRSSKRVDC